MAKVKTEYTDRWVTITITFDRPYINISSNRFHIDILDYLRTRFCNDMHCVENDPSLLKRFTCADLDTYNNTSDKELKENGIQFWAEGTNILKIRMHDLYYKDGNPIGFTTNIVTIDMPTNPENPRDVERVYTTVVLFPKLIKGDIYLKDESDANKDTQLKEDERRPDFIWDDIGEYEDTMYVNTSAGCTYSGCVTKTDMPVTSIELDHDAVPCYCIDTSAYIPTDMYTDDPNSKNFGIGFNFSEDLVSSCMYNACTNTNSIDIPYTITSLPDYTFPSEQITCKAWKIVQKITTKYHNKIESNQVYFAAPISGVFYGDS